MKKIMTKGKRPGENRVAWDTVLNLKWLSRFPFVGKTGAQFEARAVIVPAVKGAILQGSSLLLALDFSKDGATEGVNLTLSVAQAKAMSAILGNFLTSRETAHEAIRGAFIDPDGNTRWGTAPQAT